MNAKIIDIIDETSKVKTFKFKLDEQIDYEPGQFIMLILEEGEGESKTVARRAYSISSWNSQPTNEITITLNHTPHGKFSTCLFNSKIGDKFRADGPHGLFKLNNSDKPVLFLAAGTGITPLMTMIESLKDSDREMTLVYSIKKKEDIIFSKKLQEIADSKRLKFIPTLTQEEAEGWKTGRVTQELIGEAISHPTEAYICGMPEFINSVKEFLKQLNIDEKDIHTERW
tara:strand:- start:3733 stop:4416 length:684 start_codon:yes stop_codon:yes gene_type:complete